MRRLNLSFPARIALAMGIAFAVGLVLFAALYLGERAPTLSGANEGVSRPDDRLPSAALPAPQHDGDNGDLPGLYGPAPADPQPVAPPPPAAPPPAVTAAPSPATAPSPTGGAAGVDQPPRVVRQRAPAYPRASLRRGERGEVLVRVQVGVDGSPVRVDVARSSGHQALDRAAVRAVQRWRFEPARRAGRAIEAEATVPVEFVP